MTLDEIIKPSYRKTRYRKVRFANRVSTKKNGWLAPSVRNKIETHLAIIDKITKILPITNIVVEVASFDIQKIKNPDIQGKEYQEGEQFGFWNVREYVLCRDNHTCQCGAVTLNVRCLTTRTMKKSILVWTLLVLKVQLITNRVWLLSE